MIRINESYDGVKISPFRPFRETDWNAFAGATEIGEDDPLIYESEYYTIVISGDIDEDPDCIVVQLYIDEGDEAYGLSTTAGLERAVDLANKCIQTIGDANSSEEVSKIMSRNTKFKKILD